MNKDMYMPRLRKINDAIKEIKQIDPNTPLKRRTIKMLINAGMLTTLKLGPAWLINIDELYSIFWKKEQKQCS